MGEALAPEVLRRTSWLGKRRLCEPAHRAPSLHSWPLHPPSCPPVNRLLPPQGGHTEWIWKTAGAGWGEAGFEAEGTTGMGRKGWVSSDRASVRTTEARRGWGGPEGICLRRRRSQAGSNWGFQGEKEWVRRRNLQSGQGGSSEGKGRGPEWEGRREGRRQTGAWVGGRLSWFHLSTR